MLSLDLLHKELSNYQQKATEFYQLSKKISNASVDPLPEVKQYQINQLSNLSQMRTVLYLKKIYRNCMLRQV